VEWGGGRGRRGGGWQTIDRVTAITLGHRSIALLVILLTLVVHDAVQPEPSVPIDVSLAAVPVSRPCLSLAETSGCYLSALAILGVTANSQLPVLRCTAEFSARLVRLSPSWITVLVVAAALCLFG